MEAPKELTEAVAALPLLPPPLSVLRGPVRPARLEPLSAFPSEGARAEVTTAVAPEVSSRAPRGPVASGDLEMTHPRSAPPFPLRAATVAWSA